MKNIGFLLLHIDNNPYTQSILRGIENTILNDYSNHYVVFGSSVDVPVGRSIPILHIDYAKYFDGDIWFFNIESLQFFSAFNVNNIYFYANDAPWLSNYTNYKRWEYLLTNESVNIITNSKELSDIYTICWKPPIGIMEKFDYDEIQKFI